MKQICFILLLTFANGCKYINPDSPTIVMNASEKSASDKARRVYENGSYCAIIKYYNPDTKTNSACNLLVEVENNELVQIYSCDCNWKNKSQLVATKLDETGSATFESNKSNEFTITIHDKNSLRSKKFQCDICGKELK